MNTNFDSKDAFPEEALDKLIDWRATATRLWSCAPRSVPWRRPPAAAAPGQKERPAAVELEPVVQELRMSLRDHCRAERQRDGVLPRDCKSCPRARRAGAWLRRGPRARTRGDRSARRSRRSGGARHRRRRPRTRSLPHLRALKRPISSRRWRADETTAQACTWPSPTRAPTPRWTRTLRCGAAAPARRSRRGRSDDPTATARRTPERLLRAPRRPYLKRTSLHQMMRSAAVAVDGHRRRRHRRLLEGARRILKSRRR